MKNTLKVFCFIATSCCIVSCSKEGNAANAKAEIIINIDNIETEKEIMLSSLFKHVIPIILETTDESLIGKVNKIEVMKDQIFVLDASHAKGLFVFDKQGSFIRKIGCVGYGPGEFSDISDFTIDSEENMIYILDYNTQTVLCYDLTSGEYINSIMQNNEGHKSLHIAAYKNKLYTDMNAYEETEESYLIQEIDKITGKQKSQWLDADSTNCGITGGFASGLGPFYQSAGGSPRYAQIFMNTIYSIDDESVSPFIKLEGENLISTEYINKKFNTKTFSRIMQNPNFFSIEKVFYIKHYVENSKLIYFQYENNVAIQYSVFYNKKTKETEIGFPKNDILFDKTKDTMLPLSFYASDDQGFYSVMSDLIHSALVEHIQKGALAPNINRAEELLKLTEDSNPVIFYYELKN